MKLFFRNRTALLLGGLAIAGLQSCSHLGTLPEPAITPKKAIGSNLSDEQCWNVIKTTFDSNGHIIYEQNLGQICSSGGGDDEPTPPPPSDPVGTPSEQSNFGYTYYDIDPCVSNLFMASQPMHTMLANTLRTKRFDSQTSGYTYNYRFAMAAQLFPAATTQEVQITFPAFPNNNQVPIDGIMSTHTAGMLSIFTVNDLYNMCRLNYTMESTSDYFTSEIYTAAGPTYSLTFTQTSFATTFRDKYLDTPSKRAALEDLFTNTYNIRPTNSNDVNEAGFVKMLRALKTGLNISKEDPSRPGHWIRLEPGSNNTVIATPCD